MASGARPAADEREAVRANYDRVVALTQAKEEWITGLEHLEHLTEFWVAQGAHLEHARAIGADALWAFRRAMEAHPEARITVAAIFDSALIPDCLEGRMGARVGRRPV